MEEPEKQRFVTRASSYRERGSSGRWTLVGDPSNNWQVEWWAALRGTGVVERSERLGQVWMNDFWKPDFKWFRRE